MITLAVVAALALPVVRNHDSFPLSTYPMYAHKRDRQVAFVTVVGIDATGQTVRLGLPTIADSDDALETASFVRAEVRSGRAAELCTAVAGRSGRTDLRIEVVTETVDVVDRTRGDQALLAREVHAVCEVPQ
ncbi:MAG: hypothetical protein ACR2QE_12405 [Acidimicrobiales bacterium]